MRFTSLLAIVSFAVCADALAAADDIAVTVTKEGAVLTIDVQMPVEASAREAWAVLTDYEHMAAFVSNLKSSAVLRHHEGKLEVEQIGESKFGLLTYSFRTVRSIELVPLREIRSTLVSGEFKSYSFTTRIVERGDSVLIINHGEYEPTTWVPPVMGPAPLIENETRRQYAELRDEIMRRKRSATAKP